MKVLYVIAASQDYKQANHRMLWERLSELENTDVVVTNIPADFVVTVIKRKFDRIKESMSAPVTVSDSLKIVRPFLTVRPEITTSFMHKQIARQFWKCVNCAYPVDEYDEVRLVFYNAYWAKILDGSLPNLKMAYYLFDEVRNNGNDNSINPKRYREDMDGCNRSAYIFAMSKDIAEARNQFEDKIYMLGNGAEIPEGNKVGGKIKKSVAFIGNFRSWIDLNLLKGIIEQNEDYGFFFIGPIEDNMRDCFEKLQSEHNNVFYGGCKGKEQIGAVYSMFETIIIPYKQTSFIHATRPIKIVEAVMAGVPVVTVPVSGYEENDFIHFATNVDQFSAAIRMNSETPIDRTSDTYKKFVNENTWVSKARTIDDIFKGVRM